MDSYIGWIGGKRALRKDILARFPLDKIDRYIEPFGGAGWVLFAKPQMAGQLEVYNDLNSDLVNLHRCVKYHCGELQRVLADIPLSRELFNDYRSQLASQGLTDIQRAARYYYLIRHSFGADTRTVGIGKGLGDITRRLPEIQNRLQRVMIEHKSYSKIIPLYDRPQALFYCDPPYRGCKDKLYDHEFCDADHQQLRAVLGAIKGRFLLSYNDDPYIRNLYDEYTIETVTRRNQLASTSNNTPYIELLIRNF